MSQLPPPNREDAPGPGYWKASDGNWYPPSKGSSFSTTPKGADERKALLARNLTGHLVGGRLESQSDFQAVVVKGKPVNHVLHLILTLVTCGFWGIVWLVLGLSGGEKRSLVQVDEFGNVTVQQL